MKITKAVIPCGGAGSRFFPVTKAVPKEMLPIIDTPVLSYIIKEAADSGITDVLIILGKGKEAIRKYFSKDPELEAFLLSRGRTDLLDQIKDTGCGLNIVFEYQSEPKGSGDAVLLAERFTGSEPFCLALGDDIMHAEKPVLRQLMDAYDVCGKTIVGVQEILTDDIVNYGVARILSGQGEKVQTNDKQLLYRCTGLMEKPPRELLPSRLACMGRYILEKNIYSVIRETPVAKNGELQLTDALNTICGTSGAYVYDFEGQRYDMGNKLESVKAVVDYTLRDPGYRDRFLDFLKSKIK